MSTCISSKGEYSSHTPDNDYVCTFCGVLDEDALIAELNRLRAERDRPASTYRLPEWLGAHEVLSTEGDDSPGYVWATIEPPGGIRTVGVRRDALVEVRPPSIEDPVEIPLRLAAVDYDGKTGNTVRIEAPVGGAAGEMAVAAYIQVQGNDSYGYLTAVQALDAARALWLLGTGKPHSDPIGGRVVAVQQPGRGSS